MGPPDPKDVTRDTARDLSALVGELAASKADSTHWLTDPEYAALRHRMEAAHPAADAALVEARRRVRPNERQGERRHPRADPRDAPYFASSGGGCQVEPEKTPRERAEDLISLLVSDWRPTPRQSLWGIRIATVLVVLIAIGYAYGITLWDWAKLLIVPAALAFAGLWFNAQQKEREQNLAREHAQDEALQSYLDQMGRLLLDKDMELAKSKEGDEVRTLARAWTLTVLTRLGFDGLRKRSVVQFLYEAKLITKDHIPLDLREAYLNFAKLNGSDFYLTRVNLHGASLTKATMNATNLVEADLSDTRMFGANLILANLRRADMSRAVLMSSNTDSIPLPRSSVTENYSFDSPGPKNANLRLTDLREVDLTDAYVSEEQLLSAASLAGATMPNGQKYEDWLKDREMRQQDE